MRERVGGRSVSANICRGIAVSAKAAGQCPKLAAVCSAATSEASASARFLGVDVLTRPAHREVTSAASDQRWPSPTFTPSARQCGIKYGTDRRPHLMSLILLA